jgi:hypothetical protein
VSLNDAACVNFLRVEGAEVNGTRSLAVLRCSERLILGVNAPCVARRFFQLQFSFQHWPAILQLRICRFLKPAASCFKSLRNARRRAKFNVFLDFAVSANSQHIEGSRISLLQCPKHRFIDGLRVVFKDGLSYFGRDIAFRSTSRITTHALPPRFKVLDASSHCFLHCYQCKAHGKRTSRFCASSSQSGLHPIREHRFYGLSGIDGEETIRSDTFSVELGCK